MSLFNREYKPDLEKTVAERAAKEAKRKTKNMEKLLTDMKISEKSGQQATPPGPR